MCQERYGTLGNRISTSLPNDLTFVQRDQLPLQTPPRLFSSAVELTRFMVKESNDLHHTLLNLYKITSAWVQNGSCGNMSGKTEVNYTDLERLEGGAIIWVKPDVTGQASEDTLYGIRRRKCRKNREWEKRQKGYKAEWLRIDNVARVQRARKRRQLRSSLSWPNLSRQEQNELEKAAFSHIEKQRQEKKAKAKAKACYS